MKIATSRCVIAASEVIKHNDCHPTQSGLTEVLGLKGRQLRLCHNKV